MQEQSLRQVRYCKAEQPTESVIPEHSFSNQIYHYCHQQAKGYVHQSCGIEQYHFRFRKQAHKAHEISLHDIGKYVIQSIGKSVGRNPHLFLPSRRDLPILADKLRDQISRMFIRRITIQRRCVGQRLQQCKCKCQCQESQQI